MWTGSTNISEGGIFGQTNVGHWVRNADLAKKYFAYWTLLSGDPGMQPGHDTATRRGENRQFKAKVVAIEDDLVSAKTDDIPQGLTPIFSPRNTGGMLKIYAQMLAQADLGCITLAFTVNDAFKDLLVERGAVGQNLFPASGEEGPGESPQQQAFRPAYCPQQRLRSLGAYIDDPVYQWAQKRTRDLWKSIITWPMCTPSSCCTIR